MLHPVIYNTSEVCHAYGVNHIVLSPGSRNAPLILSFARNEKVKKWVFPDERAAAFAALGIAQKLKQPVAICCTSGTALLNYYPAVAEAYYRQIPLVVLSADRPPELVDQRDGQTIRQFEALDHHVKSSHQLPIIGNTEDEKMYNQRLSRALKEALQRPTGPVHINIPFAEPFYPEIHQELQFSPITKMLSKPEPEEKITLELQEKKVLVLIGQQNADPALSELLRQIQGLVPIIQSPLNNLAVSGVKHVDLFLRQQQVLKPDILLTSGLSVLSKKLKNFIRAFKPEQHYHFDPSGIAVDTFNSNPTLVRGAIGSTIQDADFSEVNGSYLKSWHKLSRHTSEAIIAFEGAFCEASAAREILEVIPPGVELHLSNSMAVRWAELFGVKDGISTYANRGTSGIDGCTSTALGHSLVSEKLNVLLTGDLGFFYDRNAFFHNYASPNLRIIVLNNLGGGIFRLIEGPSGLPELETYFETRHRRTAEYLCKENLLEYHTADSFETLRDRLSSFFVESETAKVLEVFTNPEINQKEFNSLKAFIYERINQVD